MTQKPKINLAMYYRVAKKKKQVEETHPQLSMSKARKDSGAFPGTETGKAVQFLSATAIIITNLITLTFPVFLFQTSFLTCGPKSSSVSQYHELKGTPKDPWVQLLNEWLILGSNRDWAHSDQREGTFARQKKEVLWNNNPLAITLHMVMTSHS